ncbi:MAG: hypothetical protein PHU77_00265 [Simplicispira sp.]|nr:hypothetical protein [Simplicispira sp.]
MTDSEIIKHLGGATAVAKRLGLKTPDGARRVHNWIKRGIPAQIKLDHPRIFNTKQAPKAAATAMEAANG